MISYFVKIIHIFTDSARGSQTFAGHCIDIYIYIYIFTDNDHFMLF